MNTMINDKDMLLNREVGLVEFNRRILALVVDESSPLLERLNYLCIVSKNCDELFEVRVARLLKLNREQPHKILPDGITVADALYLVREAVISLYDDIYKTYNNILKPELKKHNIVILPPNDWNKSRQKWIYNYFVTNLKTTLTPISIDPSHPFPKVPNKNLHFAIELNGVDQYGRNSKIAIIEAPRVLPRVIKLPKRTNAKNDEFILLQDIVSTYIDAFFTEKNVIGCYPFRVTRNASINLTYDVTKNLRSLVTKEVQNRKYAECSRLEIDISSSTPDNFFIDILINQFHISKDDLYLAHGPVNLTRLKDIYTLVDNPKLKFKNYTPGLPQILRKNINLFDAIKKEDILIHTPYQSFDPVVELTKLAATDPDVVAVKMTMYRIGADSELAQNLILAAKSNKEVVASIELFARFDEATNALLANSLENAGAHVVYGVMGCKVHAKMLLIARRENNQIQHYVHLGTGNYHQQTAKMYTDFGLLTANPLITGDVDNIFAEITGHGRNPTIKHIYQAPFNLFELILQSIESETMNALNGKYAVIMAKMNSLIENQVIKALYRASQAGVKITLIVRGACALRPGLPGVSDNIEVRSIVGRFLEHHRVFYFYNNGAKDVYLSSADWMKRNFFRRVETCIPILDDKIKRRIIYEGLEVYLQDTANAWIMDKDGNYTKVISKDGFSAQEALLRKLT